jgi:uncharacterized protein (DUF952 family)
VTRPTVVYKVLTADDLAALKSGVFKGAAADLADGFIHFSTASQLAGTIDRHFRDQSNLVIAAIDLSVFDTAIRWEPSRGGELFPHLYGSLSWSDVIAHGSLEWEPDGAVKLP